MLISIQHEMEAYPLDQLKPSQAVIKKSFALRPDSIAVFCKESISKPRYETCCFGFRELFFRFIKNPRTHKLGSDWVCNAACSLLSTAMSRSYKQANTIMP
ncbi:hypothetical protein QQF64_020739 [Cirrhinus molitorella]|uniref:Uncharacterized protein n=1 Tax=Cirrhinus molitorella TaxID=172907 RepID=A0ABR3LDE2_9TELE